MTEHLLDGLTDNEIVQSYEKWAHSMAFSWGGYNNHEHDDLVQEALIGVWESIGKHDKSKGALAPYAAQSGKWKLKDTITRHKYTGQPSTSSRTEPPIPIDPDTISEDSNVLEDFSEMVVGQLDVRQTVREAMAKLTEEQQVYLFLRFWCDMTPKEIQTHVESGVHHMWVKIREHMKRELGE